MPEITIRPARNLAGAVRPPGDKSVSHRYAILCSLADGESLLENYSTGADCRSTLRCFEALGVKVDFEEAGVRIQGAGLRGLKAPTGDLDAGNSGSTIRMMAGILAAQPFATRISGDASLSRRPMQRVIDPLRQMGARIDAGEKGRPPLEFSPSGTPLRGITYPLPVASAQVKSCLLLAGLYAQGETVVIEPQPTRDHTEIALGHFGVPVQRNRGGIRVQGPVEKLTASGTCRIPGDPSSAAFFLCAGALFPESTLVIDDVSLNPTRAVLLDVLRRMGAEIDIVNVEDRGGELVGTLTVSGPRGASSGRGTTLIPAGGVLTAAAVTPGSTARLKGTTISGAEAVALIDEIPALSVLATATEGGIEFSDAAELRVKESDRIATVAANLRAMGAQCTEKPDGLIVPGDQKLHGAVLESFGDHRIAMAFSIAGLIAEGETTIREAECASISYPEFYATLDRIAER